MQFKGYFMQFKGSGNKNIKVLMQTEWVNSFKLGPDGYDVTPI